MIRAVAALMEGARGIPRESGDDPCDEALKYLRGSYSPRERG